MRAVEDEGTDSVRCIEDLAEYADCDAGPCPSKSQVVIGKREGANL